MAGELDFEVHFIDGHVKGRGYVRPNEGTAITDVHIELVSDGMVIDEDGARPLEPGRYIVSDGFFRLSPVS